MALMCHLNTHRFSLKGHLLGHGLANSRSTTHPSLRKQSPHRHIKPCLARRRRLLVILAQSSRPIHPSKRPFHRPPLWNRNESTLSLQLVYHLHLDASLLGSLGHRVSVVGTIHQDELHRRNQRRHYTHQGGPTHPILNGSWGDRHGQDDAQNVHKYMALSALDLLSTIRADFFAWCQRCRLLRLAIHSPSCRSCIPSSFLSVPCSHVLSELLKSTFIPPTIKMFHDRRPWREVVRKVTELNPGTFHVANRVKNFSGVGFGKGDSRDTHEFREEGLVLLPLFITPIGIVSAPRCGLCVQGVEWCVALEPEAKD
jgi:hypothetical protein